ncbi:MAG: FG-GAP-like repeat-containing protein [Kiritimatiellae bacterium]|nr:FG-GAP-like repeat-containing protein [Kiritimatiellia bacterium]
MHLRIIGKLAFALFLSLSLNLFANAHAAQWHPRGIGGGGSLFAPSISPHDTNEIFITCDMTEEFHTVNLGLEWEVLPFTQLCASPGVGDVGETCIQFTSDPNILYTIRHDYKNDDFFSVISRNHGVTWDLLPTDPTSGEAYYLRADENATNRLFVTSYDEIFYSSDGGNTFGSIYSSSDNWGAYIAGAFWDGNTIYIGVTEGLLVSTDNGNSFSAANIPGIPVTEGVISLAGAKEGGNTRFVCVTLQRDDVYPGQYGNAYEAYQNTYTLDYGVSTQWTRKTNGIAATDCPYHVGMAKNNIDVAYIAGGSTDNGFPVIYKTTDGGDNWQEVFLAQNNQNIITGWSGNEGDEDWWYGECSFGFTVASADSDMAIITDFGFAHVTTDGGKTWRQMYVSASDQNPAGAPTPKRRSYRSVGLENTSSWGITWLSSNNLFSGYADITAIRSVDGGVSWSKNYTGLNYNSVYHTLKHPTSNILYAAASSEHDIYQSHRLEDDPIDSGTGAILFSRDMGANWQMLHDFKLPVICLALEPNDSNSMYASVVHSISGGIYVSHDIQNGSASTWTKLTEPNRTEGHPYIIHLLNDGTLVCTYSGRITHDAFTRSSGVFVSTDGGYSWADRSDAAMEYWTKDIVIDPHDSSQNTWYVCVFNGWGGPSTGLGGLYVTKDRGLSWRKVKAFDRAESCTLDPRNADAMYVTTEYEGLWYTSDLTSSTPTFTLVSSYPFQHPLRVFHNPYELEEIWVTSFGNGLRVLVQGSQESGAISDYDGDGKADPVVVDSSGNWTIWFSTMGYQKGGPYALGMSGTPTAGDFDGDRKADPVVVDASGNWYVWFSTGNYQQSGPYALGMTGVPLAADFDGDGKADPVVYSSGSWTFKLSSSGYQSLELRNFFGASGYMPAAGDIDGDGKSDLAVMGSSGEWYVKFSSMNYAVGGPYALGVAGTPLLGDIDGDGKADPIVVDSSGNWYVWFSGMGYQRGGPYALSP